MTLLSRDVMWKKMTTMTELRNLRRFIVSDEEILEVSFADSEP